MSDLSFSVVCIMRNEAKVLPKLGASLKEFLKRGGVWIAVDTGSTDKSVEVAKSLGAVVYEVGDKYRVKIDEALAQETNQRFLDVDNLEEAILKEGDSFFDFSSARNFAASKSPTAMVSMVDADEAYTKMDIDKIEEEIKKGADSFEYWFTFSHDAQGNELKKFIHSKFYNRDKIEWRGIIHELLFAKDGQHPPRIFLGEEHFKLSHFQNHETDRGGYLKGLALDCFQHPDQDRQSHYFARELFYCNRPYAAMKEFKRHIEMNKWLPERAQSMLFIGDCYQKIGKIDEAIIWWHKAFSLDSTRRSALMRLAQYYFQINDFAHCAAYSAAALEIPFREGYYMEDMNDYRDRPHYFLYWAKWWLGDRDGSKYHFDKALAYNPYFPKYLEDSKFYYPDYPDSRVSGWMTFPECRWLYETAKTMGSVVEVGSWKGRSTHALLSGCLGPVTAIDHFMGSNGGDLTLELAKQEDVAATFRNNVGSFPNLNLVEKSSQDAAELLKDEKFDMVFIDAEHTYSGLKKDIELWKGKAKKVLCGHDYCPAWPGVMRAVDEALGKPDKVVESIWIKYIV